MRRVTALTGGLVTAAIAAGVCVITLASPDVSAVGALATPTSQSATPDQSSAPVAASEATPAAVVTPDPSVLEVKKSVISGVSTSGLSALDEFITTTDTRPAIYSMFEQWSNDRTLDGTEAEGARQRGMTPSIAWEPWDPRLGVDQPQYRLQSIVDGDHDAYLATFADSVAAFGDPVIIRLMHEGNGDWYPWGAGVNGNSAATYVAAWHHIHDLFVARGVSNVVWEWAPNISSNGTTDLASIYPGDDYVDQIGLSGYNWQGSQTFDQVFKSDLAKLSKISDKSIWISETGSGPDESKAQWIESLYAGIARYPQVVGFVWFDHRLDNGQDWRIETSASAVAAWQKGARDNLR